MKKLATLLIAVTVVTSVTGCGCGRRFRDWLCRGAYCGGPPTAAAPIMAPPVAMAPPAYGPVAFDPGCGYGGGVQTYGYGGGYDSGWTPGCDTCGGSYALPGSEYDQGYTVPSGGAAIDPSPAPLQ